MLVVQGISRVRALHQAWHSRLEKVRRHRDSFQDEKMARIKIADTSEFVERTFKQSEENRKLNC